MTTMEKIAKLTVALNLILEVDKMEKGWGGRINTYGAEAVISGLENLIVTLKVRLKNG